MMRARIVVQGDQAQVFAPFALKDLIKSFPSRRWDPVAKCWRLPVLFVDEVADTLRAAGCVVHVTRRDGTPWQSGRREHGHRATPATGWADALFAAVGPDRADAVFRALQKVLHPDVGGEHGLAQQLNAARERAAFNRRAAS